MYLIKQSIDAHVSSQVPAMRVPYNIRYLDSRARITPRGRVAPHPRHDARINPRYLT